MNICLNISYLSCAGEDETEDEKEIKKEPKTLVSQIPPESEDAEKKKVGSVSKVGPETDIGGAGDKYASVVCLLNAVTITGKVPRKKFGSPQ